MMIADSQQERVCCLVIGAGKMGIAHIDALQHIIPGNVASYAATERNRQAVERLGAKFYWGDLDKALEDFQPTHVIIASPAETLVDISCQVIHRGVQSVLIEKPAALGVESGQKVAYTAATLGCRVWVAYNRRFYSSVLKAKEMIAQTGESISGVYFEFTEWASMIEKAQHLSCETKAHWLLVNSMHVIDTAFYPIGLPDMLRSQFIASGLLAWHPAGAVFVGSGLTVTGVPFSYYAGWDAPGRWGVEWMTPSIRYIFRPIEKLHIMRRGSIAIEEVELDDGWDQRCKPGVYLQDHLFLLGDSDNQLVPLREALDLITLAFEMAHYSSMHGKAETS